MPSTVVSGPGPGHAGAGARASGPSARARATSGPVRTTVLFTVVTLVLLTALRLVGVQTLVVPSSAMAPALAAGERVVVLRWPAVTGDLHRGDVVVVRDTAADARTGTPHGLAAVGRWIAAALAQPTGEHDRVGRVVGLPGEHVTCCDAAGSVLVDGVPLDESYLTSGTSGTTASFDVQVPQGQYLVLPDDRSTTDAPEDDAVAGEDVVGLVGVVYWPWADRRSVHGADQ